MTLQLRAAILIGHSVDAAEQIVRRLPKETGLAVLLAMPGVPELAERLAPISALPVIEVAQSVALEADRVYILPDECNLSVNRVAIVVEPGVVTAARSIGCCARSPTRTAGRASRS